MPRSKAAVDTACDIIPRMIRVTGLPQCLMQGEAEEAIRHCRRQIERVGADVERLQRTGQDATRAQALLKTLQQVLAEHEANRDRLAPKDPWIGKPIRHDP